MRRFAPFVPPLLLAALVALPAHAQERSLRPVPVGPFHAIEVTGMATVVLVQGDREEMSVEAPHGTQARIRVENDKGVLTLAVREESAGTRLFGPSAAPPPRITLTFRTLDAIRLAGIAKLEAARIAVPTLAIEAAGATRVTIGALDTPQLAVQGAGAFKAEIAGRAVDQRVEIAGAGDYRAGELASETVRVEVSGAGRVLVRAEKTLDVEASGAGVVEYLGNPKVTQEVSGAGRVRRRERVSRLEAAEDPEG